MLVVDFLMQDNKPANVSLKQRRAVCNRDSTQMAKLQSRPETNQELVAERLQHDRAWSFCWDISIKACKGDADLIT